MPTFGSLLKKKKTKESPADDKASQSSAGTQPVQKLHALSPVSSKIGATTASSDAPSQPSQSTATAPSVTSPPPDSTTTANAPAESNGAPPATSMNVASLVNPPTGAVDGKNAPRQTKGKYTLTDFNIQRTLGTGSFGRVHLVQSKHNQRFYAVKVLKKAQVVKMKQIEHTNDERKMLQRVKHPFLITLWGTFQDSRNLYMVMDFIEGGELFSLLRKSQVCRRPAFRMSWPGVDEE